MARVWNWTWLTVAFLAELAALAALAVWGWSLGNSTGWRVVLAVAAPAVAAVLWGVFAAPRAPVRVAALTLLVKLAVALAAAALLSSLLSTPPAPADPL